MDETGVKAFDGLMERMEDLPSLPSTVVAILAVLNNPESSANELSEALRHDQSLTSRVLRLVNSAYYGFPRKIDTLQKAVTILGYTSIQNIILVTKIFEAIRNGSKEHSLNRKRFWRHSLGCGVTAQIIGTKLGLKDGEEIFLAGLLHDIGKVILDAFLFKEYSRVIEVSRGKNILLFEAEEQILGATHEDLGYRLAEEWSLPLNLTAAIAHHHDPVQAGDQMLIASLVHIGDILVRALEIGHGGDDFIPPLNRKSWGTLRLTPKFLEDIIPEIETRLVRAQAFIPENS